jgi:hypothetical protein
MANILTATRADYSKDIAHYLTFGANDSNYCDGLIFLACMIGSIGFVWGFVLVVLKLKGPAAGCASGRAFQRTDADGDMINYGSTDVESEHSRQMKHSSTAEEEEEGLGQLQLQEEDLSMHSSIPSAELFKSEQSGSVSVGEVSEDSTIFKPTKRQRRTQITFLLFAFVTLACVPLVLIFSFGALKASAEQSAVLVSDARDILNQVQASLDFIQSSINATASILSNTPLDMKVVCPLYASNVTGSSFATELQTVLSVFSTDGTIIQSQMKNDLFEMTGAVNITYMALNTIETYYDHVSAYIYLIPGILLPVGALVLVGACGVIVAWRNASSKRLQRILFYGILPCLIAFSLACWIVTVGAAITTAVGSDSCLYNSVYNGSPSAMIEALLNESESNRNGVMQQYVSFYSSDCNGEPSLALAALENDVQNFIDYVWKYLSQIQATNTSVIDSCGSAELMNFLIGARDLAKLMASTRRAVASSLNALSCERAQPIYLEVVNDGICNKSVAATAWSFVLFLAIALSSMVMISLRASWRQQIGEEKILEESEVAENMIVDEHEEYLAYISKYKHEWQEYRGFDRQIPYESGPETHGGSELDSASQSHETDGHRTYTTSVDAESPAVFEEDMHCRPFDPYQKESDAQSLSTTGGISFLSLISREHRGEDLPNSTPPPLLLSGPADHLESNNDIDLLFETPSSVAAPTRLDLTLQAGAQNAEVHQFPLGLRTRTPDQSSEDFELLPNIGSSIKALEEIEDIQDVSRSAYVSQTLRRSPRENSKRSASCVPKKTASKLGLRSERIVSNMDDIICISGPTTIHDKTKAGPNVDSNGGQILNLKGRVPPSSLIQRRPSRSNQPVRQLTQTPQEESAQHWKFIAAKFDVKNNVDLPSDHSPSPSSFDLQSLADANYHNQMEPEPSSRKHVGGSARKPRQASSGAGRPRRDFFA